MDNKKKIKIALSIALIFLIIYCGMYIRGLTHVATATMLSGRNIRMEFGIFGTHTHVEGLDTSSTRIFLISGSVGAVIYACIVIIMSYNFNSLALAWGGFIVIIMNLVDWILAPYLQEGDFYRYLQTDKQINPAPVVQFLVIFLVITMIMCFSTLCKIDNNKQKVGRDRCSKSISLILKESSFEKLEQIAKLTKKTPENTLGEIIDNIYYHLKDAGDI